MHRRRYTGGMNSELRGLLLEARDRLVSSLVVADEADARLEAEILLCHALGVERSVLYAGLCPKVAGGAAECFRYLIERRRKNEPVAYITGTRGFYGMTFQVRPGVLIPRPETELLVERALAAAGTMELPAIVDVGCGSGCVGIALAARLPEALVIAVDLSAVAVAVTRENAARLGLDGRVTTIQGDLLGPLTGPADIIVANLPYVNAHDLPELPRGILAFEPLLALDGGLDGGLDGLDLVRRLVGQAPAYLRPGGSLFLEVGYDQGEAAADLLRRRFPGASVHSWRDLGGHVRVVGVELAAADGGGRRTCP
jgi:release factor glutamine methyltransferase